MIGFPYIFFVIFSLIVSCSPKSKLVELNGYTVREEAWQLTPLEKSDTGEIILNDNLTKSELTIVYEQRKEEQSRNVSTESNKEVEELSLHFEDITLEELIKVFSNPPIGLSFVSTVPLNQKVSIYIESIPLSEIPSLIKEIIASFGYSVFIDKKRKIVKIFPPQKPLISPLKVLVYQIKYISAKDLHGLIMQIMDKSTTKAFVKGNTLVLVGPEYDIELLNELIKNLDEPIYKGKYIAFIKTKTSAKKIKDSLLKFLSLVGLPNKGIVENLSENLLVLVTNSSSLMEDLKTWVSLLENSSHSTKQQIYILKLNYLNAETMAELLNELNLTNVSLTAFSTKKQSGRPIRESKQNKSTEKISEPTRKEVTSQVGPQKSSEGKVKIVADKSTNTLIIRADPFQFELIKNIIKKLDNIPKQVFIEMVVAEVSLGDALNFGFEGLLKGFIDSYEFNIETSFGLRGNAAGLLGFKAIVFGENTDIRSILNFLASKTRLNVLSAPYILVKNNEEAKIEIGAEVPIVTEQMTSTSGGVPVITTAVQYRPTGIILRVRPTISSDGSVTLKIEEEVSDALPNTISPDVKSPIITKRSTQTVLILRNGQVALIGGILQERYEKNERGVPVLSDIPGIGMVFKRSEQSRSKTELIVLLKVHVIDEPAGLGKIREEILNRLKDLKKLINFIKSSRRDGYEKKNSS